MHQHNQTDEIVKKILRQQACPRLLIALCCIHASQAQSKDGTNWFRAGRPRHPYKLTSFPSMASKWLYAASYIFHAYWRRAKNATATRYLLGILPRSESILLNGKSHEDRIG
jgi:hypothetical protein